MSPVSDQGLEKIWQAQQEDEVCQKIQQHFKTVGRKDIRFPTLLNLTEVNLAN